LASQIIGAVDVPINASKPEILSATRTIAEEYERTAEVQAVKEVVTAAAKKEKAVV
jgi:hypothetical protein